MLESFRLKIAETLIATIGQQAEELAGKLLADQLCALLAGASWRASLDSALEASIVRFEQEYVEIDEDLPAALVTSPAIWNDPVVQQALLEMIADPFSSQPDEPSAQFSTVLPERRNRERVDRAVGYLLRAVAQAAWSIPGADEVGQLARALDRMRLRLAQLDHARREFIANASHELRTPVFALGGFLELLRDEELDDGTRREFFATMSEQVDRLAKLATELLDLSRVDAGRLQVGQEQVDLGEVAGTVVDEFTALAVAGGRALELDASEGVWVDGDEQRVLQIGRALVENALVHTPEGTQVWVRVRAGLLEVEDDGPGIPPEDADQVFERFYRGGGPRASGSGLGLAIARELALAMSGTLELVSRPGGTVFSLRLPVATEAPMRDHVSA